MKIAVISHTGSVGKTALCANLLAPRLRNPIIYDIETLNQTACVYGKKTEEVQINNFPAFLSKLSSATDDMIIDVGASNVESFIDAVIEIGGVHNEIDYFLIPIIPGDKFEKETISTIQELSIMGVSAERILVVFNKIPKPRRKRPVDIESLFSELFAYLNKTGKAVYDKKAIIYESKLYDILAKQGIAIDGVLSDKTDYKAKLTENLSASQSQRTEWSDKLTLYRFCNVVDENLQYVFNLLFPPARAVSNPSPASKKKG